MSSQTSERKIFTARRRRDVLDRLITFFQADNTIAGLVLVGSAAEDDLDMYSGLDLLVAVTNGSVFPSVYRKWKRRLIDILPVAYDFEISASIDHGTFVLMLEDYMEITLYFLPMKNLVADRRPWQVLFDHSNADPIEDVLRTSYTKEMAIGPTRIYKQMMDSIWQPIIKCVAAINRGQVWKALHMLDRLRDQTITLASLNHAVDTRNYAEVDQLPNDVLDALRGTMPADADTDSIRQALKATCTLFFAQAEELEAILNFSIAGEVRERMMPYVEMYA
ncbi:MAG: aminoglycoside 6-adenylyltransferase [Chloroflexota bacterium]